MALTRDQKLDKLIEYFEEMYGSLEKAEVALPKPTEGFVKGGTGWRASTNPRLWKLTKMKDNPNLYKVVDDKGKNVATHFTTEKSAQYYIDYYRWTDKQEPPDEEEPPKEEPVKEEPVKETPPSGAGAGAQKGPYPQVGTKVYEITKKRAIRHYASDAPDDETVERNAKGIKAKNHQFITYVTLGDMEHPDTMSQKVGGTHMGSGWFVNSIGTDDGLCGIGVEKVHPKTSHNDVKGDKIGDIVNKKIGMASVYFADKNLVELWVDTGNGKWVKKCEGTNVKGFNPKSDIFECQLRIDGFKKGTGEPEIHSTVVQDIAAKN
jgi:hypothetical protein